MNQGARDENEAMWQQKVLDRLDRIADALEAANVLNAQGLAALDRSRGTAESMMEAATGMVQMARETVRRKHGRA